MNAVDISAFAQPSPISTAGLAGEQEWRSFFGAFQRIVLVANSVEQRVSAIAADCGPETLFVFFNKLDRVLDAPFHHASVLVTRSNQAGSELVYRGTVGDKVALIAPASFLGILNLRTDASERLNEPDEFGATPAGNLDLAAFCGQFYPANHTASSGFALAVWLARNLKKTRVELTGFSATRSDRWKLFQVHDWTFEQTSLQLLHAAGQIHHDGISDPDDPYPRFAALFPEISADQYLTAALPVLSQRLEKANLQIDRLMSVTAPLRAMGDLWHSIRPKTRKARLLARKRARS